MIRLLLTVSFFVSSTFAGETLISRDPATAWRYLDAAADPGEVWRTPGFDDQAWKSGPGPLGYGERGLGTTLSFGDDPANKPLTAWFRRSFTVKDPAAAAALSIQLVCDDGAVIYLNGAEIARVNMPAGVVTHLTAASTTVDADDEGKDLTLLIPKEHKLRAGENVLAVEVHQGSARSSDLFLSLELKSWARGETPPPQISDADRKLAAIDSAYQKNPGDMQTAYDWVRGHVEARAGLTVKVTPRPLPPVIPAEWRYITESPQWPDSTRQLTPAQALSDLDYLEEMIANCYSYADRRGADWRSALDALRASITGSIGLRSFLWRVERFMTVFGDPHSYFEWQDELDRSRIPVLFLPDGDKVLAFKTDRTAYLNAETPYVSAIEGISIDKWLAAALEGVPRASDQYQRWLAFESLTAAGHLAWQLGLGSAQTLTMTLASADGKKTAQQKVKLGKSVRIRDWPERETRRLGDFGYLRIAEMKSGPKFISTLDQAMADFRETHGIIIDVRGNSGGTQDAIRTLLPYFMQPDDDMKVINIAAYRLPLVLPHPNPSGFLGLQRRGLHPISSSVWQPAERTAIENFMKTWKPKWELPAGQFSDWHFMGITHSTNPKAYPDRRPVVVLQNSGCFSATDNFLGALKGHPGVTLLGTASGGGSGRMASYELPNARAPFTLCQMASFATTGQTYDGYGVPPDVVLEAKPADYLVGGEDSQLEAAVNILHRTR